MVVFIDRQHAGKIKKVADRGAGIDLNNDGQLDPEEMEAHWTGYIGLMLEARLLKMGHSVIPISDGQYSDRHTRVNEYSHQLTGDMVYLAMHLNAGLGDYGAFFYDKRSSAGKQLANMLCESMLSIVPSIPSQKPIAAEPGEWTEHAFNTIKGVGKPVAICCEPFFIDQHKHLLDAVGASSVALGIATALHKWAKR